MRYRNSDGRFIPLDDTANKPCKIDAIALQNMINMLSPAEINRIAHKGAEESYLITLYIANKTQECRIPVGAVLQIQASLAKAFNITMSDLFRSYSQNEEYLFQDEYIMIMLEAEGYSQDSAYMLGQYISDVISNTLNVPVRYSISPAGFGTADRIDISQKERV